MEKLTREKVVEIVGRGRLDVHAIGEIVATGGTPAELLEALSRVVRGGSVGAESMRPMGATVAALCDILSRCGEDWADEER